MFLNILLFLPGAYPVQIIICWKSEGSIKKSKNNSTNKNKYYNLTTRSLYNEENET